MRSRVGWCVCGRVRARRKYKGLFVRPEAFVRREISCPLPLSCFFFISGDRRGSVSRLDNNNWYHELGVLGVLAVSEAWRRWRRSPAAAR